MSEPEELRKHEEIARAPVVASFSREVSRVVGRAESAADGTPCLREDGDAALANGVWQSDGSRHRVDSHLSGACVREHPDRPGRDRQVHAEGCLLLFRRQAQGRIGNALNLHCEKAGFGLIMHTVDISVGRDQHDLVDKPMQDSWMA